MYFVSVLFQADLETQRLIWKRQSRTTTDKIKLFIVRTTLKETILLQAGQVAYRKMLTHWISMYINQEL
jgi:hypothetical protein